MNNIHKSELAHRDPVKYNPEKTHFEQFLEYLNIEGNPDIDFNTLKNGIYSVLESLNTSLCKEELVTKLTPMFENQPDMHCLERYIRDGKKNYRIAKDFSEALVDASLDISCKYIPKQNKSYNIQFHKDVVLPSIFGEKDITYRNCYVSIEDCDTEYERKKGYLKRIILCFPVYLYGTDYHSTYDYVSLVFKEEDQTVMEALVDCSRKVKDRLINDGGRSIIKYITNVILYINSGDPDLRELRKPKIPSVTKNPKKFEKKNKHKTLLDIIEVGFNYMKGIKYSVEDSVTRGHFRWQPYGTGRSQIYLKWIDSYTRNFNNQE